MTIDNTNVGFFFVLNILRTAFLLNVGKKELQIELVSVGHVLQRATSSNIELKRWLLSKSLSFSNSDKVCSMAIVKLKESSEKYDFAIFDLDSTFDNQFRGMFLV